ncbi:MAG: endonuclease/exonuclease/phosphatase family protein, partial [Pseudomonadota bacterium]
MQGLPTAQADEDTLRVLTRNVYVGADIFRVFEVDPVLVIPEIAAVYETVVETDFEARAEALADEIAATEPHLIGLQEVALLRRQSPGDVFFGNPVQATEVELDYLQVLLDALAARGQSYTVGASVDNADVELPLFLGPVLDDIRLTDRDVILVRDGVATANAVSDNFDASVTFELSGVVIDFKRGWNALDATVGGSTLRFVHTHMEVGGAFGVAVQAQQIAELIDTLADETLPVVMLGDFNASPNDPAEQAYGQLVAAGYSDAWLLSPAAGEPGLTCCHDERLLNEAADFTSRIDHVFVRSAASPPALVVEADVLGEEPGDRVPSGLWPSDHAGVAVSLVLPVADSDGDGVGDGVDNCLLVVNPAQRDTDGDGFGNLCDADFTQDLVINFADLAVMRQRFMTDDADTDLDGDGAVNFKDLGLLKSMFFIA